MGSVLLPLPSFEGPNSYLAPVFLRLARIKARSSTSTNRYIEPWELIDGCGNLPLKIVHDNKSGLTWILQSISLGLHIRNNNLIDLLDHVGLCHVLITGEFKTRVAACSLALVD